MFFITWITDNLAIGPALNSTDLAELKNIRIAAVIDVRSEATDDGSLLKKSGIDFLHIDVDDRHSPTKEQLDSILNFANPLLDKNKRILVHCQNGYGRSPLVVIAILVNRGMDISDAISLMYGKHPTATFTPQQEKFIYGLKNF